MEVVLQCTLICPLDIVPFASEACLSVLTSHTAAHMARVDTLIFVDTCAERSMGTRLLRLIAPVSTP